MPSSLTILLPSALGFSPHPPVSVYGTGSYNAIAAFLATRIRLLRYFFSLPVTPSPYRVIYSPTATSLGPASHYRLRLSACVPAFLIIRGTGILTSCPSATHFCLTLGPDCPAADQLYGGNLGYSAGRILTFLSLLIPAFSLL